jgi:ribosomal protein L13
MPEPSEGRFTAIWIGRKSADRNDALSPVGCEQYFPRSIEAMLGLFPLADQALDKLKAFVDARGQDRSECVSW